MLVLALIVISMMQIAREVRDFDPVMSNIDECPLSVGSNDGRNRTNSLNSASSFAFPLFGASPTACVESENLVVSVFKELMVEKMLHSDAKALCVGEGSSEAIMALHNLGVTAAFGVDKHPFFSLFKRRFVYELDYEDNHFDFAFSRDLDRVCVPSLLVLEIERVLRPGGTGVMIVGGRRLYSGGFIRSVASFLKNSDVVQLCGFGSFSLVIFKKRLHASVFFEQFQLPPHCPSLAKNEPFMKYIEPLTEKSSIVESELSYLPKFMDISSRNRLVFINIGAGEFAKESIATMSKTYRSNLRSPLQVFIIDHKTSVLSSYVKDSSTNFVYYPALGGDETASVGKISSEENLVAPLHEEAFDFVRWFDETVYDGDFVVLMMNAKSVEMNILVEMFKNGAICHVDELFLRCEDDAEDKNMTGNCNTLFTSLRKSGVYAHQWLGD